MRASWNLGGFFCKQRTSSSHLSGGEWRGQQFYFRKPAGGSAGAEPWEGGNRAALKAVKMVQEMDAESCAREEGTESRT